MGASQRGRSTTKRPFGCTRTRVPDSARTYFYLFLLLFFICPSAWKATVHANLKISQIFVPPRRIFSSFLTQKKAIAFDTLLLIPKIWPKPALLQVRWLHHTAELARGRGRSEGPIGRHDRPHSLYGLRFRGRLRRADHVRVQSQLSATEERRAHCEWSARELRVLRRIRRHWRLENWQVS